MDLLVVILIVCCVSAVLAMRAYRFFQRAAQDNGNNSAGCSGGCVGCGNGSGAFGSGKESWIGDAHSSIWEKQ